MFTEGNKDLDPVFFVPFVAFSKTHRGLASV
jgi:hypothetical protein